jgi:hypothetical protein
MKPTTYRNIRWFLIGIIGISVWKLTWYARDTGIYVGDSRVRVEAAMVGAGHRDIFGPLDENGECRWVWTPDPWWAKFMKDHYGDYQQRLKGMMDD